MMKVNDFQKYEVTLKIPYESYFGLIYETKYLSKPDCVLIAVLLHIIPFTHAIDERRWRKLSNGITKI